MKKTDGRALPHAVREEIRKRAVAQVMAGESPEAVIEALGFHRSCIYEWLEKYRRGGEKGLETKPIKGRPPLLPDKYADALRDLIKTNPLQLNFHDALWTREMIQDLLERHFKVSVSIRTVGNILKRFGITVQRPRLKAYEQDEEAVRLWLDEQWPAIRREAKQANAVVYFGDESSIRSDYHKGTTWGIRGETPVVEKTGRRFSVNMISAISPRGHLRFMVTEQRLNASTFKEFLRRLLHGAERPIFLIVDGHPVHRSKAVCTFVENTQGKLRLFYLPPYSPQLNADELVWNHVKSHHLGRTVIKTKEQLRCMARSVLRSLQRNTELLQRFFQEQHVRYVLT